MNFLEFFKRCAELAVLREDIFTRATSMDTPITENTTTEVSIHTNLLRDLYIVLGEGNNDDGWVVRIYYNPLVVWIWIGVLVIIIGGLSALKKNLNIIDFITIFLEH